MRALAARTWVILGVVLGVIALVAAFLVLRPGPDQANADSRLVALPSPAIDILASQDAPSAPVATPAESSAAAVETFQPAPTDSARVVATDPTPVPAPTETVILAGGCFWGVQGVFEHVKGVVRAESGYIGGDRDTANYESVSTGSTGHAEAVKVTYDPAQVTFGQILQLFFSVVHDPTELDRQGPDTGPQYRSAIFAQDADQELVAEAYIAQLADEDLFPDPIVTTVEVNTAFFPAEAHHQDFMAANPNNLYIVFNDQPKLYDLEHLYPDLYRADPVLLNAGS